MNFEGAEICYYINGESYSVDLSPIQFSIVIKILGLNLMENGDISCYSDNTLKQIANMIGNPLHLKPANE